MGKLLGKRIMEERKKKRMPRRQLCDEIQTVITHLVEIEKGKSRAKYLSRVKYPLLAKIAVSLDLPLDELIRLQVLDELEYALKGAANPEEREELEQAVRIFRQN